MTARLDKEALPSVGAASINGDTRSVSSIVLGIFGAIKGYVVDCNPWHLHTILKIRETLSIARKRAEGNQIAVGVGNTVFIIRRFSEF